MSAFTKVVEPEMQREIDCRYLSAVAAFRSYRTECGDLRDEVQKALDQLELLQTDYKFVTNKTGKTVSRLLLVRIYRSEQVDVILKAARRYTKFWV